MQITCSQPLSNPCKKVAFSGQTPTEVAEKVLKEFADQKKVERYSGDRSYTPRSEFVRVGIDNPTQQKAMRELAEKYSPGITKAKFELRADRPLRIKNESTYDSRFNPDSDDIESVRIRSGEIRSFEDLLAFYPITYKTQSHFNAIATRPQGQLMQSVEMPPPRSTTSPSFSDGRSAAMIVPSPNSTSYPIQQFLKTSDSPIISAYSQTSSPSISSEIGRMGFTPSTKRTFGEMSTGASESS